MEIKYDVFISYKRQSLNIVKAIAHVLDNEGISFWYDTSLDEHAGEDYADIIADKISESRLLIAVLTDAALESDWVKAEVKSAFDQKKLVIPFVVAELHVENGITFLLNAKQWIDAYPNPDRKFALLLKNVKSALNDVSDAEDGSSKNNIRFSVDEDDFSADFDFEEGEALYQAKEYNDAALAFMASAERGNRKSQDILCQMFYDLSEDIASFDKEIWTGIELQARSGHCYANFLMHCKLYKEVTNNLVSFEYLKKAIKNNSIPLAFLRMGIQYCWGMGIRQSHTLGMHYYHKALNMGCKEAYSYIAQEYRCGNDKIPKDINKAIELLEEGIAAGDNRSYGSLIRIYLCDLNRKEDARKIAQKAISVGYSKGYSLLGDIAMYDDGTSKPDWDEAIQCYKKALLNDDKEAYGSLAWIYYNKGEFDEALHMAKRGRMVYASSSYWFLGFYYETNNQLNIAWQYYNEQFEKCGTGAEDLARLVIEKKYFPEGVNSAEEKEQFIDRLEQIVEIGARNSSKDCLTALLKLYSYENNESYDIDCSLGQRVPKVFELMRLGAEMGMPDMMYYLGKGMMNDHTTKNYNPIKGLEWIRKSAEQGYLYSIKELLKVYSEGIWEDKEGYKNTLMSVIRNYSLDSKESLDYLNKTTIDNNDVEIVKPFIEHIIKNDDRNDVKAKAFSYVIKYKDTFGYHSDDKVFADIRQFADTCLENNDYGYLRQMGIGVLACYPEYDRGQGAIDFFYENDSLNAKLFYSFFINIDINIDFKNEVSVRQQDEILKMLFEKIRNDVAFKEFVEVGNNDLIGANKDLINAYVSFSTSYRAVCQEYNIIPIDYAFPTYQDMIPCQFLKTVLDAWKIAIKMLYTLRIIPEIKEVIDNLKTYDEILAIAENETDDKLQLLLIEVVDIAIETDNVLNENYKIWQSFENREDNALVERINNYIGILNTCMKENKFENYKTEDITQFYPQKSRDAKIDGVDDFDKLLDNFLSY